MTVRSTHALHGIEHFKDAPAICQRLREKGRMMPDGLNYISSWIDTDFKVCYQLMEAEDVTLFERWTENWNDLMEFKIVPVRTSAEAAAIAQGNDPSNRGKKLQS